MNMQRVFLYLYPIKEYTEMFLLPEDKLYDEWNIDRPLPILNSTINKRYREKGYQIIFALFPDRELYGIEKKTNDKIIFTDITYDETSTYDRYPSEEYLLHQLGNVDELVIGGYHVLACCKRVAEVAMQKGISVLVDLDLTDLFFNVYRHKEFFNEENYNPNKFKTFMITQDGDEYIEYEEKMFDENYSSPVYGYSNKSSKIR